MRSRTKMSRQPLVAPGTRSNASLANASTRPWAERAGARLRPFAWEPPVATLARSVSCANAGVAATSTRAARIEEPGMVSRSYALAEFLDTCRSSRRQEFPRERGVARGRTVPDPARCLLFRRRMLLSPLSLVLLALEQDKLV